MNAVRLQAEWRPVVGLTDEDQGSLVERVLAETVIDWAVAEHNRDMEKLKKG